MGKLPGEERCALLLCAAAGFERQIFEEMSGRGGQATGGVALALER